LSRTCIHDLNAQRSSRSLLVSLATADAKPLQALWNWGLARGVEAHGVLPAVVPGGGRGVVASVDLPADACFLSVPGELLATSSSTRREPRVSAALLATGACLRPAALLAVHLLHEASKVDSAWLPYLGALPRSYSDGGSWSEEEAEQLQAPHAVSLLQRLIAQRRDDWRAAAPVLETLGLPLKLRSESAWSWAASTVATRTVYVPADVSETRGESAGALCPVGDLVNHGVLPDGTPRGHGALDCTGTRFCFYTACDVKAGQEVLVSYGDHCSLATLSLYGFLDADATHDTARLPRSPHLEDVVAEDEDALHVGVCDGAPGWRLLAALRLAHAAPAMRRARGHTAAAGEMMCSASEAAAFRRLGRAAAAALTSLPTSLAQDAALDGSTLSDAARLALAWRVRYKQALRRCLEACAARLACLDPQAPCGPRLVSGTERR